MLLGPNAAGWNEAFSSPRALRSGQAPLSRYLPHLHWFIFVELLNGSASHLRSTSRAEPCSMTDGLVFLRERWWILIGRIQSIFEYFSNTLCYSHNLRASRSRDRYQRLPYYIAHITVSIVDTTRISCVGVPTWFTVPIKRLALITELEPRSLKKLEARSATLICNS